MTMKEHKSELQQKVIALDHALNQARYELSERAVEVCINVLASLQFIRQEHAKSGALLLYFSCYYYYYYYCFFSCGCRDGAVVRALAFHQCGPGSIPISGVKCGLSLLVLFSAPSGFLRVLRFPPGTPVSPLLKKPKFEFDLIVLIVDLIYNVPN